MLQFDHLPRAQIGECGNLIETMRMRNIETVDVRLAKVVDGLQKCLQFNCKSSCLLLHRHKDWANARHSPAISFAVSYCEEPLCCVVG